MAIEVKSGGFLLALEIKEKSLFGNYRAHQKHQLAFDNIYFKRGSHVTVWLIFMTGYNV